MPGFGFLPQPSAVGAAQAAAAEAAAAAQAAQRAAQAAQAAQRGVQQAAALVGSGAGGSGAGMAAQQMDEVQYMQAVQDAAMRRSPMEFYPDAWGKASYIGQPDQFADASGWTSSEYEGFSGSNIVLGPYG